MEKMMKTVKICGKIIQNDVQTYLEGKGNFDENKQIITWNDDKGVIYQLDLNKTQFIKEDKESKMSLLFDFEKITNNSYVLKENNMGIQLEIFTDEIKQSENSFEVTYYVLGNEEQKINFNVSWEEE